MRTALSLLVLLLMSCGGEVKTEVTSSPTTECGAYVQSHIDEACGGPSQCVACSACHIYHTSSTMLKSDWRESCLP